MAVANTSMFIESSGLKRTVSVDAVDLKQLIIAICSAPGSATLRTFIISRNALKQLSISWNGIDENLRFLPEGIRDKIQNYLRHSSNTDFKPSDLYKSANAAIISEKTVDCDNIIDLILTILKSGKEFRFEYDEVRENYLIFWKYTEDDNLYIYSKVLTKALTANI